MNTKSPNKNNNSGKKYKKKSPASKTKTKRAAKQAHKSENLNVEEKNKQKRPNRVFNREIEVMTSIKITKSDKSKSKSGSAKKEKKQQTPKKSNKSSSKSPKTKTIVRKRHSVTPQKPKRVKRQKLDDTKAKIPADSVVRGVEQQSDQVSQNISEKEEGKQQTNPSEEEAKFRTPQKATKAQSPLQTPKVEKEEEKGPYFENKNSKVLMPLEIKKMLESSASSTSTLLDSLQFPSPKSSVKILQHVREISIGSVKKIQNTIQRVKGTERKLKELERKASEHLKRKGLDSGSKDMYRQHKYTPQSGTCIQT